MKKNSVKAGKKEKKDKKFRPKNAKKSKCEDEITQIISRYADIETSKVKKFSDFPFSRQTHEGLRKAKFVEPTEIQRESIGIALKGCDLLGAAMTGSGKTLAFVIPILECLWRNKWSQLDGLGALVISPTRELALQTYETLRTVGCRHDFSAALIIGGTDVQFEKERISRTNIIVGTPGRILQHMDENPAFSCDNLQILVLDEADRILDLGFNKQLNALVENFPGTRQTLLFSATQTKSVKDLARLSLHNPMYVSVHEHAEHSTPANLQQCYMVCEEEDKINLLWSFVKNHLNSKILVFLTNCKQVRFIHEAFRQLRPGMPILGLHGSMNQMKRVDVYEQFCRKQRAVLFATDIAARGLDFPDVNWVLQLDCPSDAVEYIHRSGRTARFRSEGRAMLVLTPSQEGKMVEELEQKKIPISRINANRSRLYSIQKKLEVLCTKDPNLKTFAQRAFVSYIRSIFVMSNKEIFKVDTINHESLAKSFGLVGAPRVRFLKRTNIKKEESADDNDVFGTSDEKGTLGLQNFDSKELLKKEEQFVTNDEEDDDDFLIVKKKDVFNVFNDEEVEVQQAADSVVEKLTKSQRKPMTKEKLARKLLKKKIRINKKVVFEDVEKPGTSKAETNDEDEAVFNIEEAMRRMEEQDKIDRELYRGRIKAKHREERRKAKLAEMERRGQKKNQDSEDEEFEVTLGNPDEMDAEEKESNFENSSELDDEKEFEEEEESEEDSEPPLKKQRNMKTTDEEIALRLLEGKCS